MKKVAPTFLIRSETFLQAIPYIRIRPKILTMQRQINLTWLASTFEAYLNCVKTDNKEWQGKHWQVIEDILEALPHGSGIDRGVTFLSDKSTPTKLIFTFSFHFMDDHGHYDGWEDYTLTITPTFGNFDMNIKGKNRRAIKDYFYDLFGSVFVVKSYEETTIERNTYHNQKAAEAF